VSIVRCPDDAVAHPRVIANPPGSSTIDCRIGDYSTFRRALLAAGPGEVALAGWDPGSDGDIGAQLLEWWAYLADVLVFYNERAQSAALLRTATAAEDIQRTIRLLGYRPRPGIGATGFVAALTDSARSLTLRRGLPIQGPGGPGLPPQVFELDEDVEIGLVGRPLPPSARFAASSGVPALSPSYAGRLPNGRLRNWIGARDSSRVKFPRLVPGVEVVVAVEGIVTNVSPDDVVAVLPPEWDGGAGAAITLVHALEPAQDDDGRPVTKLTLHPGHGFAGGVPAADCRILKPTKSAHLWLYHDRYPGPKLPTAGGGILQGLESIFDPGGLFSGGVSSEPPQDAHVLTSQVALPPSLEGAAHLEGITRGINPGDPVLFEQVSDDGPITAIIDRIFSGAAPSAASVAALAKRTFLTKVTGYSELIWYANPPEGDRIGQGPPIGPPSSGLISGGPAPIPIPHSKVSFSDPGKIAEGMSEDDAQIKTVVVHYAWEEIGPLVDRKIGQPTTAPEIPADPEVPPGTPAVIEDATGAGWPGSVGRISADAPPLVGPLRALINLLPVSRGETVTGEVIGSGNPALAGQEFRLGRGPLTYLADTGPGPFDGYRSTLRIHVGGIEWHEVAGFYGQPADAHVFATREDHEQRTYVRFGDGVHGARLPAGVGNVVAEYRVGSGAEVPAIGTLTTILRPQPGLASIRNPIAPGGGSDPDPPEQIRRYAPRSVLTFGRAVSGDDYETVAAQTPGVDRARAVWGWDPDSQRTAAKVLVGDDDAAVAAARTALRAFADPNRPIVVLLAEPIYVDLTLVVEVDPDYEPEPVRSAAAAALLDPQAPPFGYGIVRIGSVVYDSEIYDACLAVPGVVAVHGLAFRVPVARRPARQSKLPPGFDRRRSSDITLAPVALRLQTGERHAPGDEHYYLLSSDGLHITTEAGRHGD
jgi:hypothetical protein